MELKQKLIDTLAAMQAQGLTVEEQAAALAEMVESSIVTAFAAPCEGVPSQFAPPRVVH